MREFSILTLLVLAACGQSNTGSFEPTKADEECRFSVTMYDPSLYPDLYSKSELLDNKIAMLENCQNLTESTFRFLLAGKLARWLEDDPLVIKYAKIVHEAKAMGNKKYEGMVEIKGKTREFSLYISEDSGAVLDFDFY